MFEVFLGFFLCFFSWVSLLWFSLVSFGFFGFFCFFCGRRFFGCVGVFFLEETVSFCVVCLLFCGDFFFGWLSGKPTVGVLVALNTGVSLFCLNGVSSFSAHFGNSSVNRIPLVGFLCRVRVRKLPAAQGPLD